MPPLQVYTVPPLQGGGGGLQTTLAELVHKATVLVVLGQLKVARSFVLASGYMYMVTPQGRWAQLTKSESGHPAAGQAWRGLSVPLLEPVANRALAAASSAAVENSIETVAVQAAYVWAPHD